MFRISGLLVSGPEFRTMNLPYSDRDRLPVPSGCLWSVPHVSAGMPSETRSRDRSVSVDTSQPGEDGGPAGSRHESTEAPQADLGLIGCRFFSGGSDSWGRARALFKPAIFGKIPLETRLFFPYFSPASALKTDRKRWLDL